MRIWSRAENRTELSCLYDMSRANPYKMVLSQRVLAGCMDGWRGEGGGGDISQERTSSSGAGPR